MLLVAVAAGLALIASRGGIPPWSAPTTHGELLRLIHFYLPAAGALNALIAAWLVLALKKRRGEVPAEPPAMPPALGPTPAGNSLAARSVLAVSLASVLACGWLAWPRLSQSLWGDEHWTLQDSIAGRFQRDLEPDGSNLETVAAELNWEGLGWEHTLWRYWSVVGYF